MTKGPLKFEGEKISLSVVKKQLKICMEQNEPWFLPQTIQKKKKEMNYRP